MRYTVPVKGYIKIKSCLPVLLVFYFETMLPNVLFRLWTLCSHAEAQTAAPPPFCAQNESTLHNTKAVMWPVKCSCTQQLWGRRRYHSTKRDSRRGLRSVKHCWMCGSWRPFTAYPQACLKDKHTAAGRWRALEGSITKIMKSHLCCR